MDLFRELLAAEPAERTQMLTNRPPATRQLILRKVREYASMKPDQRELRLRATELRWYLLPLMSTAATNRGPELAVIPADHRQLVVDRLREWDKLSPAAQKALLDNEATLTYFSELNAGGKPENVPATGRKKLEEGIAGWNALPLDQRRKIAQQFNQYFALTAEEKTKALQTLSEPERRQIDKTLKSFETLPPAQRAQCIHSFEKFAGLSAEERRQFLKNAERWKRLSPDERQSWRELVARLSLEPPPFPPRPPPLPIPNRSRSATGQPMATNH